MPKFKVDDKVVFVPKEEWWKDGKPLIPELVQFTEKPMTITGLWPPMERDEMHYVVLETTYCFGESVLKSFWAPDDGKCVCDFETVIMVSGCKCGGR